MIGPTFRKIGTIGQPIGHSLGSQLVKYQRWAACRWFGPPALHGADGYAEKVGCFAFVNERLGIVANALPITGGRVFRVQDSLQCNAAILRRLLAA